MVQYKIKMAKSILNRLKVIDSWFWCRYTLNAYNGCEHACVYCDARSQRYHLHEDFDETIYIKKNASQLLDQKLRGKWGKYPDVISFGGSNDAYQPIEKKCKITRSIWKVLLKYKFPTLMLTKNALIERDFDLIRELTEQSWVTVGVSVTTMNQQLATFLEPGASTPNERMNVLKHLHEYSPKTQKGVMFMPIIPIFEDTPEQLEEVIKNAKDHKADFILAAPGVTLRDTQGEFFIMKLSDYCEKTCQRAVFKEFKEKFGPNSKPNPEYYTKQTKLIFDLCKKHNISPRMKRWIPSDYRKENYEAAEKILNIVQEREMSGKSCKNLKWAGLNIQNLDTSLSVLASQKKLDVIPNFNHEVYELIKPYLNKPRNLDSFF